MVALDERGADGVPVPGGQREVDALAEEPVGDLDQDPGAVAGVGLGTDRTAVVDAVERQVAAVREVVSELGGTVPVTPVLCAREAGLPVLSTLRVRGIPVLSPGALATLLERPGRLTLESRTAVADAISRQFPPA